MSTLELELRSEFSRTAERAFSEARAAELLDLRGLSERAFCRPHGAWRMLCLACIRRG